MAHTIEWGPLAPEQGATVSMLGPKRYFYKSAKWLGD